MNDTIAQNLLHIQESFPADREVALVAVSKFQPAEKILAAYEAGQRRFGESRVQELEVKARTLPADIRWHFIGHLQTNKVRQLLRIPGLSLIESIDSFKLLEIVDAEAFRLGITARVLMEVHVAREETKFGFETGEIVDWFNHKGFSRLRATHIHGIMGMASNVDDLSRIAADFRSLSDCFNTIKSDCQDIWGFDTLSMGMSSDYQLAIEEGSTMVRIGSAIFGERR